MPELGWRPDPGGEGRGGEGHAGISPAVFHTVGLFLGLGRKGLVKCSGSIPRLGPSEAQSCGRRPRPRSLHELGTAQLALQALQLTGPGHHSGHLQAQRAGSRGHWGRLSAVQGLAERVAGGRDGEPGFTRRATSGKSLSTEQPMGFAAPTSGVAASSAHRSR